MRLRNNTTLKITAKRDSEGETCFRYEGRLNTNANKSDPIYEDVNKLRAFNYGYFRKIEEGLKNVMDSLQSNKLETKMKIPL